MLISVVIPVYNGAGTIGDVVGKILENKSPDQLEIILVNDGSRDNSHQVCSELAARHAMLTYIQLTRNFGEHNAVLAGLNHAAGDYVVIMDDDLQNPPDEINNLVAKAKTGGYDIVYTFYSKKQHTWFRNLGSRFTNFITNFLLDKPKELYLSSFKCLSRFTVSEITKYRGPFPYIDGLVLRCTNNIGTIQVSHHTRARGRSGYTFRKLVHLWLNMFINFSVLPLRISTLVGLSFSTAGILRGIYVAAKKMLHPEWPAGYATIIVAVLILSGLQLFILGILGEYLGKLYLTVNQTPQYSIKQIIKKNGYDGSNQRSDQL